MDHARRWDSRDIHTTHRGQQRNLESVRPCATVLTGEDNCSDAQQHSTRHGTASHTAAGGYCRRQARGNEDKDAHEKPCAVPHGV